MKFDHVAFQVSNMDHSIEFYTGKLGFTQKFRSTNEADQEEYAILELGDARIELIQDLSDPYQKPEIRKPYCPHFCMEVDDLQVVVDLLNKEKINIVAGPLEIAGEETWVYFADPDHNVLEYIQWYQKK